MAEAYIVDAVRAPVGRRGGGLAHVHPADLGAHSLNALMDRTGVDPAAVEDVVFGDGGGDIRRLFDADYTFADSLLAQVYGVTLLTYPDWHDRKAANNNEAVAILESLKAKSS